MEVMNRMCFGLYVKTQVQYDVAMALALDAFEIVSITSRGVKTTKSKCF